MTLVHNERVKLTATYMNGMAIALVAIGGFAPLVSLASGGPANFGALAIVGFGCLGTSIALHSIARLFLGRLQP